PLPRDAVGGARGTPRAGGAGEDAMKRALASALGVALFASFALAAGPDRTKPPSAGAPRPVRLPPVQKMALGNGLPVILIDVREVPSVEMALVVRAGAAVDPQGRGGTAAMTAEMLDEATGGRDALAIADALDLLGADLRTSCDWDTSQVRLHVPAAPRGAHRAAAARARSWRGRRPPRSPGCPRRPGRRRRAARPSRPRSAPW